MQPNKSVEEIVNEIISDYENHAVITVETKESGESFMRRSITEKIQNLLTSHTNTVLRGVVDGVKRIEIPKDNSDYELAQLRFRKDVLSLLNDQIISNEK